MTAIDLARTVTILDVGHGNAAVVNTGTGIIVIDAGPRTGLLEFLTETGAPKIDALLISHADADHIAGLIGVLASNVVKIGKIRVNSDSLKGSSAWDDLAYELDLQQRSGAIDFEPALTPSNSGDFDIDDVRIEILAPTNYIATKGPGSQDRQGRRITSNSVSAMIRVVSKAGPAALFCGDIDQVGLDSALEAKPDIMAPTLVFPHHGGNSGGAVPEDFVRQLCGSVRPQVVVFSIGRGRFGNPRDEIVQAVRNCTKARIVCTQLSERCAPVSPKRLSTHLSPVYAAGKDGKKCCGGSLVIRLDAPTDLTPALDPHLQFIQTNAPSALCVK
jgi:competence protein ComEC